MKIAIFGLGEAGSLIASDLIAIGVTVTAYDPAAVPTPRGVLRCKHPNESVIDVQAIFSLTAGKDASLAIQQALDAIPVSSMYADFSTNSPGRKKELAETAARRGFDFIDVALMGIVPGKGLRTSALVSGTGARRFVETMSPLGMCIEAVSDVAGDAATRKLLRSVMMKGLAATVIEAMRGAEKAGCSEWLWENLNSELLNSDAAFLSRLVQGTKIHAVRRLHEMEASMALLQEMNIEPVMTRSTVENLRSIVSNGIPTIPSASYSD